MIKRKNKIKFIAQYDQMDCGPACLAMISAYHGKNYDMQYLRELSYITRDGVSILGICEAAKAIGFDTFPASLTLNKINNKELPLPAILHWNQNHFVVLYQIKKSILLKDWKYKVADPSYGIINISQEKLKKHWLTKEGRGIAILLHPNDSFYELTPNHKKQSLKYLLDYIKPHSNSLWKVFSLLLIGSCISLTFPFLTKSLIDDGVNTKNLKIISLILLAQLCLFLGNIVVELIRNWIMLIVGTKINILIISNFLKKLLRLPIKFFDTKLIGDINQRISDHDRIENFLTSQSLLTFFSMLTFVVFFAVLWYFNITILLIYSALSLFAILWSLFWMKKRSILDYFRFQLRSENQEAIYEMINGVTEMKLNLFEDFKRNEWESIQKKLFATNSRILKLNQIQSTGYEFINQIKNILSTFIAASLVVQEQLTLGALLSISYIIGQMNGPLNQLVLFFLSLQDAKLSLNRLNEIQNYSDEDKKNTNIKDGEKSLNNKFCYNYKLNKISFQYQGPNSPFILKNVSLEIPAGKITAIVGASGSGKTTLLKLLLKFYEPISGSINLGNKPLNQISNSWLREKCGVVLQDGYIFGDTIERNIVCGDTNINYEKLQSALRISNIENYINSLPLGLNTKIGASGNGISGGQRQRILIARAVYKDPQILLFDEATSALDSDNEMIIHNNLQSFFNGKTVVIIAHRLSTVKNSNQIIVLQNGQIAEVGTHNDLVNNKSTYYNLIKNQLELGN